MGVTPKINKRWKKQLRKRSLKSKLHASWDVPHSSKYIFQPATLEVISYCKGQVAIQLRARPKCPARGIGRERDFGWLCSGNARQPQNDFQVWDVIFPKCDTEVRFCPSLLLGPGLIYQETPGSCTGTHGVSFNIILFQRGACFSPCSLVPRETTGESRALCSRLDPVSQQMEPPVSVSLCLRPTQTARFLESPARGECHHASPLGAESG